MSVTIKSQREIELMRHAGKLLGQTLKQLEEAVRPGMSTWELNQIGEEIIRGDAARTVGVGEITENARKLIEVTRQSFFEGIRQAKQGNHLYDISGAIGDYAESFGYGVVRDLVGHGIGKNLHEDPQIPNFRQRRRGLKLQAGMTLAIEPMINEGSPDVCWADDDWTVMTEDCSLSAHYENTVLITDGEPEILTLAESL